MFARVSLIASVFVLAEAAPFNFLAVGDWGGKDSSPYTTTGQVASADGMDAIASELNSQFVIALGDNFYSSGIHGDDTDTRFEKTFEDVYTGNNLQTPWFLTAGNHDWGGNVSAQIAYTQDSTRWTYPDYYYDKTFTFVDGGKSYTFQLVMIDTVILNGYNEYPEGHPLYFSQPPGPRSISDAEVQWAWIEETLKASTADHLWVAGHYPVYSVCEHGNTAVLVNRLKPLLEEYGANYLSGHDHCQEYIAYNNVQYVLTGMGEECCYSNSNLKGVPSDSLQWYIASNNKPKGVIGGFSAFQVSANSLKVVYYDQDGTVLYTTPDMPARTSRRL